MNLIFNRPGPIFKFSIFYCLLSKPTTSNRETNTTKSEQGRKELTWISLDWGCEASTPVQVRSEIWRAPTPSATFAAPLVTSDIFDDVTADFPPLFAAAAAFLAAAFLLLASETILLLKCQQVNLPPNTIEPKSR